MSTMPAMNMPPETSAWRGSRAFVTYASETGIAASATGLKLKEKPVRKLTVEPVAALCFRRHLHHAFALVVANGVRRNVCKCGKFADRQSRLKRQCGSHRLSINLRPKAKVKRRLSAASPRTGGFGRQALSRPSSLIDLPANRTRSGGRSERETDFTLPRDGHSIKLRSGARTR